MSEKEKTTEATASPSMKLADIDPLMVQQIRRNQTVHCLRMLMTSMHIDPDRAMALLQIPTKERKSYRAILTNLKDKKQTKSSAAKAASGNGAGTARGCDKGSSR